MTLSALEKGILFGPKDLAIAGSAYETAGKLVTIHAFDPTTNPDEYMFLREMIQTGIAKELQDHGAQDMRIYGASIDGTFVGAGRVLINPDATFYHRAELDPQLGTDYTIAVNSGLYVAEGYTGKSLLHRTADEKTLGISDVLIDPRTAYAQEQGCDTVLVIARKTSRPSYLDPSRGRGDFSQIQTLETSEGEKYVLAKTQGGIFAQEIRETYSAQSALHDPVFA